MTPANGSGRTFTSGERVEPGIYRDLFTGEIIRVLEPDELPDGQRIVRSVRLFIRVDEPVEERKAPCPGCV